MLDLYRGALNHRTAGYYLLSLLYVAAETGLIVWMVEFLQKARGQAVLLSSTFLSLYFAGIIAGRLAGSLLVDRLGYLRALLGAGIGALVCLALGIFGPPALAFCLPLAGLFFATMAPTLAAAVTSANLGEPSRVNPHIQNAGAGTQKAGAGNTGSVLGLLLAAGGIGGMLGAWSAGFVSSFAGIRLGFGVQLIYAALFVGVALALYRTHHASAVGMRTGAGHLF
jgi:fucose permease